MPVSHPSKIQCTAHGRWAPFRCQRRARFFVEKAVGYDGSSIREQFNRGEVEEFFCCQICLKKRVGRLKTATLTCIYDYFNNGTRGNKLRVRKEAKKKTKKVSNGF